LSKRLETALPGAAFPVPDPSRAPEPSGDTKKSAAKEAVGRRKFASSNFTGFTVPITGD
jgi:hypothetical protein